MGCLFKCLDPGPPDDSVRHFWHIRGLILDSTPVDQSQPCSSAGNAASAQLSSQHQHSPSVDTLQVQQETTANNTNSSSSNGRMRRKPAKKEGGAEGEVAENNTERAAADGGEGDEKQQQQQQRQQQLVPRQHVQRLPPGVLYIYEGRLVYRSRRWSRLRLPIPRRTDSAEELSVELCQIGDVNVAAQFLSQRDNKPVRCRGPLVDVLVTGRQPPLHLGFLTAQADAVGNELRDIFLRHRHRPRIFQFNSIDVDGIEIDVP